MQGARLGARPSAGPFEFAILQRTGLAGHKKAFRRRNKPGAQLRHPFADAPRGRAAEEARPVEAGIEGYRRDLRPYISRDVRQQGLHRSRWPPALRGASENDHVCAAQLVSVRTVGADGARLTILFEGVDDGLGDEFRVPADWLPSSGR